MIEVVILPSDLAEDYASSTEQDRRQLVEDVDTLIKNWSTREEVIAKIVASEWSEEFAVWVYTKVKYYGRVTIAAPISDMPLAAEGV